LTRADEIPRLLRRHKIDADQIPNPHWREDACRACHRGKPGRTGAKLRTTDINALCNSCHDTVSVHNYIHAVGMEPSAEKRERMPETFRQAVKRGRGIVTCITCHDLPMQCLKDRFDEKTDNPLFFRGGPYQERTDLCFNCHNPTHYERLNPHDQISDEGELNTERCLVCHSVTPNRRNAKSIDDVSFNVSDDPPSCAPAATRGGHIQAELGRTSRRSQRRDPIIWSSRRQQYWNISRSRKRRRTSFCLWILRPAAFSAPPAITRMSAVSSTMRVPTGAPTAISDCARRRARRFAKTATTSSLFLRHYRSRRRPPSKEGR
jgi:predicted CXXCH cytochrome family protein